MDVSTLAAIAAGAGVIAGMAWLMLPRSEDYFERSMAELLELTTAPGVSPQRPGRAACANTSDDHQPGRGSCSMTVESSESPPPSQILVASSRGQLGGPAGVKAGEPVIFHSIEGSATSAPVQRGRPALYRVK